MKMRFKPPRDASHLSFDGSGKSADVQARSRIFLSMILLGAAYTVIIGRLAMLGVIAAIGAYAVTGQLIPGVF